MRRLDSADPYKNLISALNSEVMLLNLMEMRFSFETMILVFWSLLFYHTDNLLYKCCFSPPTAVHSTRSITSAHYNLKHRVLCTFMHEGAVSFYFLTLLVFKFSWLWKHRNILFQPPPRTSLGLEIVEVTKGVFCSSNILEADKRLPLLSFPF